MKIKALLMAAMVVSSGFVAQSSYAANGDRTAAITLEPNKVGGGANGHIGNNFGGDDTGSNFLDKYTFTLNTPMDSAASITSSYLDSTTVSDLLITSFNLVKYGISYTDVLYTYTGVNKTLAETNPVDSWALTASGLTSGNYYLEVKGTVVGNGGGAYGTDLSISPAVAAVPEPETYAMMLAGMGLVGAIARRRKNKQDKQA